MHPSSIQSYTTASLFLLALSCSQGPAHCHAFVTFIDKLNISHCSGTTIPTATAATIGTDLFSHDESNNNMINSTPSSSAAEPSYRLHGDKRQVFRATNGGEDDGNGNGNAIISRLLFSNDRMRVSDFRLRPSQQTFKCKHDYPTVRWQVAYDGNAEYRVEISSSNSDTTVKDNVITGDAIDRKVYFVEAGTTWEITNTSKEQQDAQYRQIVFEFLSDKPMHTDEEIQGMFSKAIYTTDVGTGLLFENELCRCWDFYLDPSEGGGADTVHHHCLDYVFVNVAPSRLLGIDPVTLSLEDLLFDSVSEDNQVTWNSIPSDAGADVSFAHGGKNGYDDRPMREYLIELK